jgi:hypothetical protein
MQGRECQAAADTIAKGRMRSYLRRMNYVLALFLPPLSILFTGRPIVAIVVFLIWIPALFFSGGLTHPMFIILAWILIFQSREDRRDRAWREER